MKIRKLVFFILLLAVTILLCSLVSSLMRFKILDINNFGFQFLFYSLLGSVIYFALSNLRLFDSVAISVFLALIFAFILSRTSLIMQFGSFLNIIFYTVALFVSYTLIFRFLWFNNAGYLRNLVFSLASAVVYTLVHLVTHLFLGLSASSSVLLSYFTNGLLMMLTVSFAFSLTDLVFLKLDPIFFQQPGSNDEDDEEEIEENEDLL